MSKPQQPYDPAADLALARAQLFAQALEQAGTAYQAGDFESARYALEGAQLVLARQAEGERA